nr:hypothetical protein [uncultured Megasphaera sp.]
MFLRGEDPDPVLLEPVLIHGTVIAAARKTVQLIDDDVAKELLVAVLDHLQKRRALIRTGRHGPVDVFMDDRQPFLFGKGMTFPKLCRNTFFSLFTARKTGVDDSFFHSNPSFPRQPVIARLAFFYEAPSLL